MPALKTPMINGMVFTNAGGINYPKGGVGTIAEVGFWDGEIR